MHKKKIHCSKNAFYQNPFHTVQKFRCLMIFTCFEFIVNKFFITRQKKFQRGKITFIAPKRKYLNFQFYSKFFSFKVVDILNMSYLYFDKNSLKYFWKLLSLCPCTIFQYQITISAFKFDKIHSFLGEHKFQFLCMLTFVFLFSVNDSVIKLPAHSQKCQNFLEQMPKFI